ncbi:MAG: autotransporter assembly complex protein TamA [Thermodesulfobacteriota bacterium]
MAFTRRKGLWAILFCLTLLAGGPPAWAAAPAPSAPTAPDGAQAPETPAPARQPWRLAGVEFQGFAHLSRELALSVMETKPAPPLALFHLPDFDRTSPERDRQRLLQLYQEYGFFQAQISVSLQRNLQERAARVTFTAQEGPPTLVDGVSLELPSTPEGEAWRPRLEPLLAHIIPGQRFLLRDYEEAKTALGEHLRDHAHPLGTVLGQVRVHPDQAKAQVVYRVEPGPRLAFGPTLVAGFDRTKPQFILRELTYARGQPFSQKALDDSQRALLDTGFFSIVTFTPDFDQRRDGLVPIKLQVREAKPHSVRLGLGWGNEDGYRVRVLQVNRNLLGLYDTLTFEGKVSHIYEGVTGRLKLPYLPYRSCNLLLWGGVEQTDNEAFVNRRFFVNPMIEQRLGKSLTWYLGYNVEKDRMVELKAAVPDPAFENQQLYISSVPAGIRFDSRDSLLDPKRGLYLSLDLETASDAIGSEVEFMRPVADLRHVLPLPLAGWHLASRAKGGLAYPLPGTDRIPLVRRFFPGGANSVRGYPYQTLGPLDSAGKPLGGEAMIEGSVEARFPIWGELGGVAFVDAGNAYEDWEDIRSALGNLRYTAGAGLRYNTPVGPLRLDFGYQLNPPENAPIPRYEFYLSVGQAF